MIDTYNGCVHNHAYLSLVSISEPSCTTLVKKSVPLGNLEQWLTPESMSDKISQLLTAYFTGLSQDQISALTRITNDQEVFEVEGFRNKYAVVGFVSENFNTESWIHRMPDDSATINEGRSLSGSSNLINSATSLAISGGSSLLSHYNNCLASLRIGENLFWAQNDYSYALGEDYDNHDFYHRHDDDIIPAPSDEEHGSGRVCDLNMGVYSPFYLDHIRPITTSHATNPWKSYFRMVEGTLESGDHFTEAVLLKRYKAIPKNYFLFIHNLYEF